MLMHQAAPAFAAWFGITPIVTPELRMVLEAKLKRLASYRKKWNVEDLTPLVGLQWNTT